MAAQPDPRVGTFIGGKWRVDALLGSGSMASVYAVTHRNGSRAALKILHDALANDVAVCERFLGEGYLTNSIKHSGIVRVFDDGMTDDGAPFLAMDLLEGDTLDAKRTKAGGKLPMFDVIDIADKVMDTLIAVHQAGIIHRDLKPQNVFCEENGGIRLLDFGVARLQERMTQHSVVGMVLGTPSFMSPEQALGGKDVDARSDIWALGAIMFTLLSGETVHNAATVQGRLLAAASVRARSIQGLMPELHPDIVLVVDTALQFKKDDRWQTVSAMRNALKNVKNSLPPPNLIDAAFDSIRMPSIRAPQNAGPSQQLPPSQMSGPPPVPPPRAPMQSSPGKAPPSRVPSSPPKAEVPAPNSSKTLVGMTSPSGTFSSAPPLEAVTKPTTSARAGSSPNLAPNAPRPPTQRQPTAIGIAPPPAHVIAAARSAVPRAASSPDLGPDTKRGVGSASSSGPQPAVTVPASTGPAPNGTTTQPIAVRTPGALTPQQAAQAGQAAQASQGPPTPVMRQPAGSQPQVPPAANSSGKFDPHRVPYESLLPSNEISNIPAAGATQHAWMNANAEESALVQRRRTVRIAASVAAMIGAAVIAFIAIAFLKQSGNGDSKNPKPNPSAIGTGSSGSNGAGGSGTSSPTSEPWQPAFTITFADGGHSQKDPGVNWSLPPATKKDGGAAAETPHDAGAATNPQPQTEVDAGAPPIELW